MELFTFQDLILFATFLIALLTYIDRKNKRNYSAQDKTLAVLSVKM